MNFNKMSMDSDLHTEQLLEAITLIKSNESYFKNQREIAQIRIDRDWDNYTYEGVLKTLNDWSVYENLKNRSLKDLINEEDFIQEGNYLIELGEEIKSFNSDFSEIECKFEKIKDLLFDLQTDESEWNLHRSQEQECLENNGRTDDPFDEVELRGIIYETDLDEITDEEKIHLIEEFERFAGVLSYNWKSSKLEKLLHTYFENE